MQEVYERLGLFYLGRQTDHNREAEQAYYLLRSKDLLTHALCVGMTGSGKTGLCTAILEEAAIDGIPSIVIDLKGDLSNLCLSFDPISGEKLRDWVRPGDAEAAGMSLDQFAAAEAERWQQGLALDDQSSSRVGLWRENSDLAVYTPGLAQLAPISIVESLSLPPAATMADQEAVTDLAAGCATAILTLVGLQADPLSDREHILLSQILLKLWQAGQSPSIEQIIELIQDPPFSKLGVMDLEVFFPAKDRLNLALALNKLLAAPGFSAWLQGQPLNIDNLLYGPAGKAKCSIISLQHLTESERSFFLTLLLNQLLAWTRRQPGTQALRALFYMDEIQGYFPPVAEPPTKKPLLTLLKQARAFGLGLILASQNPVDLDYKGLSNIGLWLIGRLQTERDRARLLAGLQASISATGTIADQALDDLLAGLPKRHFIARNVHRDELTVFRSRQCLSYLAGPLSRDELARLPQVKVQSKDLGRAGANAAPVQAGFSSVFNLGSSQGRTGSPDRPSLNSLAKIKGQIPAGIQAFYLERLGQGDKVLKPMLYAQTEVFYEDKARAIRQESEAAFLTPIQPGIIAVDWSLAEQVDLDTDQFKQLDLGEGSYEYIDLPEAARQAKAYQTWTKDLIDRLYKESSYKLLENKKFKQYAEPGETAQEFARRLSQELRDQREAALDQFEAKYRIKLQSLERKLLTAEQRLERETEQAKDAQRQTWISVGNAVFSTIFGRKKISSSSIGKMATASKSASRAQNQKSDIYRAEQQLERLLDEREELEQEIETGLVDLGRRFDQDLEQITERELRPLKRDCKVKFICLVWMAE